MLDKISPFRFWAQKILPTVYDDSLSYYEVLCKVVAKLNDIINTVNDTIDSFDRLYQAFIELEEYVNEYINKELTKAVKNKIDEMFNDGTLGTLIISLLYKNMVFNSMEEVKDASAYLEVNSIVTTLSFYSGLEYGGSKYIITDSYEDIHYDEDHGMPLQGDGNDKIFDTIEVRPFAIDIGNGLFAVPLNEFVAPEEIGYKYDETETTNEYDAAPFCTSILNNKRNVILRLKEYRCYSTIYFCNYHDHIFDGNFANIYIGDEDDYTNYDSSSLNNPYYQKYLFYVRTGIPGGNTRKNSTVSIIKHIVAYCDSHKYSFMACANNHDANMWDDTEEAPEYGTFWGSKFIIEDFTINGFNYGLYVRGGFYCNIEKGNIIDTKTNIITASRHSASISTSFSNLIDFNTVGFYNKGLKTGTTPYEGNTRWRKYIAGFPLLELNNTREINFNSCVFERRKTIAEPWNSDWDTQISYANSGIAIYFNSTVVDEATQTEPKNCLNRFINFNGCWFEVLDYCANNVAVRPISFNGCFYTDIVGVSLKNYPMPIDYTPDPAIYFPTVNSFNYLGQRNSPFPDIIDDENQTELFEIPLNYRNTANQGVKYYKPLLSVKSGSIYSLLAYNNHMVRYSGTQPFVIDLDMMPKSSTISYVIEIIVSAVIGNAYLSGLQTTNYWKIEILKRRGDYRILSVTPYLNDITSQNNDISVKIGTTPYTIEVNFIRYALSPAFISQDVSLNDILNGEVNTLTVQSENYYPVTPIDENQYTINPIFGNGLHHQRFKLPNEHEYFIKEVTNVTNFEVISEEQPDHTFKYKSRMQANIALTENIYEPISVSKNPKLLPTKNTIKYDINPAYAIANIKYDIIQLSTLT